MNTKFLRLKLQFLWVHLTGTLKMADNKAPTNYSTHDDAVGSMILIYKKKR